MKKYVYVCIGFVLASAAGLLSINPTLAAQVSCALTIACDGGSNTSTGPGVQGDSSKGNGVVGNTRSATGNDGVAGADLATAYSGNIGVRGISNLGTGVYGASNFKSSTHSGVRGFAAGPAAGVYGQSVGSASDPRTVGVYGTSPFVGVVGISPGNTGVYGKNVNDNGNGVEGVGQIGVAGFGDTQIGNGVYAQGATAVNALGSANGVYAIATGTGDGSCGVCAFSSGGVYTNVGVSGIAQRGNNASAFGVEGQTFDLDGYGALFEGTGSGVAMVAHISPGPTTHLGTAILAESFAPGEILYGGADSFANTVYTVDDSGNGYFKGYVSAVGFVTHSAARVAQATSNGSRTTTFAAQQTAPSVEHLGEANLVGGTAMVSFEPSFAASMARGPYMVFLTPQGDTHGLYVAQKTASGFVVRETQGGRSTIAFDYRVVARPFSPPQNTFLSAPKRLPHIPIQHLPRIRQPRHLRATIPRLPLRPQ